MKKLTIALDEHLAFRVKGAAAKAGISPARWLCELVARELDGAPAKTGPGDCLDAPLWPSAPGALPSRFGSAE